MQNHIVAKKEKFAYALFFFGQNLFYNLIFLYLSFYYTEVILIPSSIVATIFLGARIFDALNDPFMGYLVDRINLKSGKFIPWIKLATFLIPITIVFMFSLDVNLGETTKITLAALSYVLFGMAYTINDAPAFSLSTVMTDSVNERSKLISYGRIATGIVTLLVAVLIFPLVDLIGWFNMGIVVAGLGFITMIPLSFICKERFLVKNQNISVKAMFNYLKNNRYLLVFLTVFVFISSFNFVETMGTYVAKYSFKDEAMMSLLGAISILPFLIVPVIINKFLGKIDKLKMLIVSLLINVIFATLNYITGPNNIIIFSILAFLRSLGLGAFMTLAYMFVADAIEYGEYKTGTRAEAITFSLQTFSTKLSGAISGALPLFIFSMVGLDSTKDVSAQSDYALNALWFSFTIIPSIALIIAIPLLLKFYKLKDTDIDILVKINKKEKVSTEELSYIKGKFGESYEA